MKVTPVLVLAGTMLVCGGLAMARPAGWRTWNYPELHLSVDAPAGVAPKVTGPKTYGEGQPSITNVVFEHPDHYALVVTVEDFSQTQLRIDPDALLGQGLDPKGVLSSTVIPWPSGRARDVTLTHGKGRLVFVNRRLYMIQTVDPKGSAAPAEADAFIGGVAISP